MSAKKSGSRRVQQQQLSQSSNGSAAPNSGNRGSASRNGNFGSSQGSSQATRNTGSMSSQSQRHNDVSNDAEEEVANWDKRLVNYVLAGIIRGQLLDSAKLHVLIKQCGRELMLPDPDEWTAEEKVKILIKAINDEIRLLNLEVRVLKSELTGGEIYFASPITCSDWLKLQTYWSQYEIQVFNRLANRMLSDAPDACFEEADCFSEARRVKGKFDRARVSKFLESLVQNGYLETKRDGRTREMNYTPGVRFIQEHMAEIAEKYPGKLVRCQLCKEMMLHGLQCSSADCDNSMHTSCWKRYREAFPDNRGCPKNSEKCSMDWTVTKPIARL